MKKLFSVLLVLLLTVSLVSCGAAMDAEDGGFKNNADSSLESSGNDLAERKIIRRVNLSMETRDFDEMQENLHTAIRAVGGYSENVNEYSHSGYRRATYVIRIPSANLDAFLSSLSSLGNVLSRNETIDDVTLAYVDTESRIKALKAEEAALIEMMEKAEDLNSLLSIRSRLTEVRYQLDSYESQLRKYDNLIDYSTVTVNVNEVERLANVRGGVWGQIGDDFMDNVYAIADGAVAFFIWFVGSIPVFVLIAVVVTAFVLTFRTVYRRRARKAEEALKAKQAAPKTEG